MTGRSRWEGAALISVLILAAVLRLGYAGVNAFGSDEARVSLLALRMARQGEIATNGISSSTGARNLPASIDAFVIPYALSTDPLLATQWVGLWSLLAVPGVWLLARRAWGPWPACVAALFMAASPFNVFFSRNIWTQNFLAPLTTVWMLCAFDAMTSVGRRRLLAIGGAVFLGGLAFQIHAAGIVLIPATLWLIVRDGWWRRWAAAAVLIGGALAGVLLLPFLHEAACCHPELITEYTQALGQGERVLSASALQFTAQIAVSYGWQYLALGDADTVARVVPLALAAGALLLIGLAGYIRQAAQARDSVSRKLSELIALIVVVTVAFFSYQSAPVRLHYLLPTLPALALLASCAAVLLRSALWRGLVAVAVVALGGVWAAQILYSLSILDTSPMPNGMGTSLEVVRDIAHALPKDRPIVVLTQSDDVVSRGEPAAWEVLLWDTPHRVVDGWTMLVLPAAPATLVTDVDGMPAWEEVQAAGLADGTQRLQILPNTPTSSFVAYEGAALQGYTWLETPVSFSSGLELVAWRSRVISGRLRISTVYRVVAEAHQPVLQQFTHLRTAETLEGPPPRTADIPLSAQAWRVGDTVIGIADFLAYDAGVPLWIDLGQYDLTTGVRYPHANGDSVRLGPLTAQ